MEDRRYYLEDELFPKKNFAQHGDAQVPYTYSEEHSKLLNEIMKHSIRYVDDNDRVYYTLGSFDPKKGNKMNTQVQNQPVELTPEQVAQFAAVAQKLKQDGHVALQTADDVGSEDLAVARNVEHTKH